MNIIIYGGSFNPPTNAHFAIAKECLKKANELNGEFWILPSGNRTDKTIDVSQEQRLCYLSAFKKALGNESAVKLELTEFHTPVLTETVDTVKRLSAAYPDAIFHWVFGSDSITTMREWSDGNYLWENLKMFIVTRPGHEVKDLPPRAQILEGIPPFNISSTQIRARLSAGEDVSDIMPLEIMSCLV